jgi:hypothetical protein
LTSPSRWVWAAWGSGWCTILEAKGMDGSVSKWARQQLVQD